MAYPDVSLFSAQGQEPRRMPVLLSPKTMLAELTNVKDLALKPAKNRHADHDHNEHRKGRQNPRQIFSLARGHSWSPGLTPNYGPFTREQVAMTGVLSPVVFQNFTKRPLGALR